MNPHRFGHDRRIAVEYGRRRYLFPGYRLGLVQRHGRRKCLADAHRGKVNPSGKMPFTTPVSLDQSPAHALGNFPGRDLKVNYEEDILVGYRWFDTKGLPVVYPFGYGLSYTTFNYSNLNTDKKTYDQADTIQATFTLTNTGDREGAEVDQLYVSDPVCSVMRPVKELKGFKKVFLKPGESRRITLDIPVSSLAFYSEAQSQFVVEPGEFILQLGASASDIKQRISVEVKLPSCRDGARPGSINRY